MKYVKSARMLVVVVLSVLLTLNSWRKNLVLNVSANRVGLVATVLSGKEHVALDALDVMDHRILIVLDVSLMHILCQQELETLMSLYVNASQVGTEKTVKIYSLPVI